MILLYLACCLKEIKIISETARSKLFITLSYIKQVVFALLMSKSQIECQVDINQMIAYLLQSKGCDTPFKPHEVRQICVLARDIFLQQQMLLALKAPLKICGDIHGQFPDLLRIFSSGGQPANHQYLFLGDYVDRGKNSLECILLLFCYKIKYPKTFFMLRGNHQCSYINRLYGFYDQCKRRCNLKIFKVFVDVFNVLPVAAVISKRIMCMHGGLSPEISHTHQILSIQRPTQIPETGPLCDLLWSDPDKKLKGWQDNLERGVSYTFGIDVVQKFLKQNDLDVICRAHQVVQQGFQFFGNRKLVTLFSAPNYCGMFDNDGAFMNVDQKLVCSFSIIKNRQSNKENQNKEQTNPQRKGEGQKCQKLKSDAKKRDFKHDVLKKLTMQQKQKLTQ